jgi:mevalonate kinase
MILENEMSKEMINNVIEKIKNDASQASKEFNNSDDENHSFMLGWTLSSFSHLLRDLELSDKQLQILSENLGE